MAASEFRSLISLMDAVGHRVAPMANNKPVLASALFLEDSLSGPGLRQVNIDSSRDQFTPAFEHILKHNQKAD